MADSTYSIVLDDQVTPGLKRIAEELEKLQKNSKLTVGSAGGVNTIKTPKTPAVPKTPKTPKITTPKEVDSVEKLDKALRVMGPTVGRIAGKFGFMGDMVESSTGAMIGMGGKAGMVGASILGVGAVIGAVVAAGYGWYKWFEKIIDVQVQMNKSLTTTRGNLGRFVEKDKEVNDAAREINAGLGKSYEETAASIAKITKATGNIQAGKEFATMKAAMEGYGEAGANVNKVLDAISEKKLSSVGINDIADALVSVGAATKDNAVTMAQGLLGKNPEKQLKVMLSNKEAIASLRKEAAASVSPFEKLKLQFQNVITLAFGAQGPTPLSQMLDKITSWLATEDAQKKFTALFTSITEGLKKITPENIDKVAKSLERIVTFLDKTVQFLNADKMGLLYEALVGETLSVKVTEEEKQSQVAAGMAMEEERLAKIAAEEAKQQEVKKAIDEMAKVDTSIQRRQLQEQQTTNNRLANLTTQPESPFYKPDPNETSKPQQPPPPPPKAPESPASGPGAARRRGVNLPEPIPAPNLAKNAINININGYNKDPQSLALMIRDKIYEVFENESYA